MSVRSWLARHRSLAVTATTGAVAVALVAGVAVTSSGYTAQRLTLGDGTVWVANEQLQAVGRANPEVLELNGVVRTSAQDLEILQQGDTALVVSRADATVRVVDPATATLGDPIPLPPEDPEVWLAGTRVVIVARGTGEVWIRPIGEIADFDAASDPTLSLGLSALVTVTPDGLLFAYRAETDEVVRVALAGAQEIDATWPAGFAAVTGPVLTAVGATWALLDPAGRRLVLPGRAVDLAPLVELGTDLVPQEPAAAGDRILLGTSTGLISVPLSGADPVPLVAGLDGVPAAPVVAAGCEFAAWASGQAWRRCGGAEGETLELPGATTGVLDFAVNIDRVVLNDRTTGGTWAVQDAAQLIDNWQELIVDDPDDPAQENDENDPPQVDEAQQPPVAVDDAFGARPGRTTVLPVLLNDYDPNADVLVISRVDALPESVGRLDLVTRNQQVQLTLADDASGSFSFRYLIDDGRGGVATATVTVDVRSEGENAPPRQVRSTRTAVVEGGRVTAQLLGDWVDPDGDPIYLTAASTAAPDRVTFKPEGAVVFADGGSGGSVKSVAVTATDGRASANGTLRIAVSPPGQLPITIEPWVAIATAGQEITVRPMSHVRGGTGTLRLNAVPARPGTEITPSFEAGTFTFRSDSVRTHYVEFTITDGTQTATGLVRIDVTAPADANTSPITVPRTIFVRTLSSETIDSTATDIDPSGGVLVVTGVDEVDRALGIRVEVLEQRLVRVTLTAPLGGRSVDVRYRISNGLADAVGTITVVEIPEPSRIQPPVARDDAATVRVGDVVDIPVLDNDEQPDGKAIELLPELSEGLPEDAGLLFAAGDRLRYLAPATAGNYVAVYSIAGPDGQRAEARVSISVREQNAATNNPPVPERVVARVIAGQTVSIPVPLDGVDPDGDSVQLIGATSSPEKGQVVVSDAGTFEFTAGEYSSGTDEFRYAVVDALGARAEGVIRVGISPRLDGARSPVANEDVVQIRPGRTVSVQVLANDSDPDGTPLRVISVSPVSRETEAVIVEDAVVDVTPPSEPGTYAVVYTIQNEFGGTSQNFITVTVDPDAPLSYPDARDTVLAASDVVDRATLDVDVLANVFFADGDSRDLGVAILPGFGEGAQILPNKNIRVTIGDRSQIIPFAVSHPEDDAVRSIALIWVPGIEDTLPQIDRTAPLLRVDSEDTLRIDLNDYVVAMSGRPVRITDSSTVRATNSNGEELVVSPTTLEFTSADQYFGPASITFEVTDGASADDASGRRAILTLPIDVRPRDNQPPTFIGSVVDFEPGQERELDLVRLTNYPYPDIDELAYSVLEPLPEGFSFELNGQRLVLRASENTPKGTVTQITLAVRDAINDGQAGRIELRVVPSTLPLVQPIPDQAITPRGSTTTIDVLANDAANNPFPDVPLRVVAIRGIDGASLPAGVTVTPNADRSRLSVTVSAGAQPGDASLQYQVADATQDESRYVWGNVTISVQDRPDPVGNVTVTDFGDRSLRVAWVPGQANNSPIERYTVTMSSSSSGSVLSTTTCSSSVNCLIQTPGNGPSNAVRLAVTATNAIGTSEPTALPGAIWSDIIPGAPTITRVWPVDGGLGIEWTPPTANGGSAVEQYVVTVGRGTRTLGASARQAVITGVAENGSSTAFSVSARNSAPNSLASWNQATGTGVPAGPPELAGPAVSASASLTDGTTATASWGGVFEPNGRAIQNYWAVIRANGADPVCSATGVEDGAGVAVPPTGSGVVDAGSATTASFTGLAANQTYSIWVFAFNGQGCTAASVVEVTPRATPGTVTAIDASRRVNGSDEFADFRLDRFTIGSGSTDADLFRYRFASGADGTESDVSRLRTFLTAGTSHYGNPVSVEISACQTYPEATLCGPWSAPFALGTPVWNKTPGSLDFDDVVLLGTWSWTSIPQGSGYSAVEYRCDAANNPGGWLAMPDVGSCDGGTIGNDLRVRITTDDGATYERAYSALNY